MNHTFQDLGNTEERIKSLISSLKHMVYEYVCRCLFKVRFYFHLHRLTVLNMKIIFPEQSSLTHLNIWISGYTVMPNFADLLVRGICLVLKRAACSSLLSCLAEPISFLLHVQLFCLPWGRATS